MSHQYLKAMLTFWYKSFKKPKFNRTKYKNSFKIFTMNMMNLIRNIICTRFSKITLCMTSLNFREKILK